MQQFTFEGDMRLEYSAGDCDREIQIAEPLASETATTEAVPGDYQPESLENYIARQLNFPSNTEFDAMLTAIRAQRASGAYEPTETDAVREGVRLKITVEVVDPGGNQQ
jgi:hypothetical protein